MTVGIRPAFERVLAIDRALREEQWPNATSLALELEVHPRTIHRDLEFMRDRLHAPIVFDPKRNGFAYTEPSFRLPSYAMTEGEYLALFLAERVLQTHRGSPFAEDLARLFRRVTETLTDELTVDLAHLAEHFSVHQQAAPIDDIDTMRQLQRAVRKQRQLRITYWTASRDETGQRTIDPYHLASIDGDWYVVAFCHRRQEVLMFAPSRVRALEETGETFDRPADFRIGDYLDQGFRKVRGSGPAQTVRLRFLPAAARYVREKTWHPTQTLQETRDGRLILRFRVNHLLEVKRWVLSFGADCEVLEPKQLKQDVFHEIEKMAAQHRQSNTRE